MPITCVSNNFNLVCTDVIWLLQMLLLHSSSCRLGKEQLSCHLCGSASLEDKFVCSCFGAPNVHLIDRERLLTLDKVSSVGLFAVGVMALAEACGVAV